MEDISWFQYGNKDIDYDTCDLDVLKKEIDRLKNLSEYYDGKQLAEKLFLNSCYGACANKFFCGFNLEVATAITLQGQDLNHFSENSINRYFKGIFQNDTELHKKLGIKTEDAKKVDISKGRITDNGPLPKNKKEYQHIEGDYSLVVAGDTDSTKSDTIISLDKENKITIEDAYIMMKEENFDSGIVTSNGSYIIPNRFGHTIKTYDEKTKKFIYKPIKYIMRHKVSKAQFKITTKSGKSVIVTGDHSIMVLRNNKLQSIKAKDINIKNDKTISVIDNQLDCIIEDIASVEQLEDFNDEYVYDVEVEDTHTFVGNDILLHNSIYIEFGRIVNQLNIPEDKQTEFVVKLWEYGCGPYMDKCYQAYAKAYNCNENLEVLELEKICRTTILYAKKHYAMEEVWEEPGVYLPDMENIIYKGLEVIQGSTPKYARTCQKDFIEYVLKCYIHNNKPSYQVLIDKLKKYKADMQVQLIDDICKAQSVGDYDKWIRDDKQEVIIEKGTPIHVRAAAMYNHYLLTNKKYLQKYSRLGEGTKVKFYYTTNPQIPVFAFSPGDFPLEFAPPVDYEEQFSKLILSPLNKLIKILGYEELSSVLCYASELF